MNNNILKQLYKSTEVVSKDIKSIDTTLSKILKLEKDQEKYTKNKDKKEDTRRKREARDKKRKKADFQGFKGLAKMKKSEKDKEKKSLFEMLTGGIVGTIQSLVGGLTSAVQAAIGGIGSVITGALGSLGLGAMLTSAFVLLKPILIGALVAGAGVAAAKLMTDPKWRKFMNDAIGDKLSALGLGNMFRDAEEESGLSAAEARQIAEGTIKRRGESSQATEEDKKRLEVVRSIATLREKVAQLDDHNTRYEQMIRNHTEQIASAEAKGDSQTVEYAKAQIQKYEKLLNDNTAEHRSHLNKIQDLIIENSLEDVYSKVGWEKRQLGGHINVPGVGEGDKVPMLLPQGSFVLNKMASMHFQTGGMVPTLLEPGEKVFMPGDWDESVSALNTMIPRFQTGGNVDESDPAVHEYLTKLNDANIKKVSSPPGMCVTGSLNTMEASGVPNPAATGQDVGNNPRGMIVQMINDFGWKSLGFGNATGLVSPYGNSPVSEMSKSQYDSAVASGKIPSGALIFQTRHDDWNGTSPRSRGYDAAIAQNNGGSLWNGQPMGQYVYGNTKKIIALTPDGKAGDGTAPSDSNTSGNPLQDTMGQISGAIGSVASGIGGFMQGFNEGFKSETGIDIGAFLGGMGTSAMGGLTSMLGIGGQDSTSGEVPPSGSGATTANVDDPTARAVLDALAKAEGTTKSYGTMFAGSVNAKLAAGELTVAEVIAAGESNARQHGSGASGRYQFMPGTLEDLVRRGVLRMDEKFTNRRQDEAALALVAGRGVNLADGLSKDEVQKLSWEWASIKGNNYTFNGRAQGKYSQETFMDWVKANGGTVNRQKGGLVGRTASPLMERMRTAQQAISEMQALSSDPIVIYDEPAPIQVSSAAGLSLMPPDLPEGPDSAMASDYFFQLSLGGQ